MTLRTPKLRRNVGAALLALFSAGSVLIAPARAHADSFAYMDREGNVHTMEVASSDDGGTTSSPAEATNEPFPYASLVDAAATTYALSPALVRAVMSVESGFHTFAVSSTGARGLMQLMPTTADELGVANPFDPEENIMGGAHQLRVLLDALDGDLSLTLAAYNAGIGAVRRAHGVPPIPETRHYVAMVLARYSTYLASGSAPPAASRTHAPAATNESSTVSASVASRKLTSAAHPPVRTASR